MNPFHSQDSKPSHSHFKATRLKLGPCASPASPPQGGRLVIQDGHGEGERPGKWLVEGPIP